MNDKNVQTNVSSAEEEIFQEQIKELVIARIRTLPDDVALSVGGEELKRDQLIEHVQEDDAVGKELIEMQLEFLQDMASGALYENQ